MSCGDGAFCVVLAHFVWVRLLTETRLLAGTRAGFLCRLSISEEPQSPIVKVGKGWGRGVTLDGFAKTRTEQLFVQSGQEKN
mgnify:CR=1 FL=1